MIDNLNNNYLFIWIMFISKYDLFVLCWWFLVLMLLVNIVGLIIILVKNNNNISKEKK